MKKRFLAIFLVIILSITSFPIAYADEVSDAVENSGITDIDLNSSITGWNGTINGSGGANAWNDPALETGTGIIKTIMNIITFIINLPTVLILKACELILPSMDTVIFNNGIWGKVVGLTFFENAGDQVIASNMTGAVSTVYQTFRYLALICFIIAIACIAVKMILASIGKQKQQYKDMLKNWLIGLMLLIVGHWIMMYLIYISYWLVDLIKAIVPTTTSSLTNTFIDAISNTGTNLINVLINLIASIVFIAMNLKIFKVYLERVIVVAVLIMLFPLVTVMYVFEKCGLKRGATFNSWFSTYVSQVFVQPIHALSLMFVMLILDAAVSISIGAYSLVSLPIFGPVIILMIINFVFKVEDVVKRVFAINGASMGQPMQPMRQVANLAKGATNAAITGAAIGKRVSSGGTKAIRKGIFKDEMRDVLQGWGKRSGVNLDRLYNMGLPEAKNIENKMKNAVKTGNIQEADIPEFRRRLIKNGDANELVANFGFNSLNDWEMAAKGELGGNDAEKAANKTKARMVLAESVNPGSAKKYMGLDRNNNVIIKPGYEGIFEAEQRDAELNKYNIGKLSKMSAGKFASCSPEEQAEYINAVKTSVLQSPHKVQALKDAGIFDKTMKTDEIIANFDNLDYSMLNAISYSEANNVKIDEIVLKDDNDNAYVSQSRMKQIGAKRRLQVVSEVVANGFKNTDAERQALVSYSKEDEDYINGIIAAEGGISIDKANAWINGEPNTTLTRSEEAAISRVFVRIKADLDEENSVYVKDANAHTVSPAPSFAQAVPSGYTTTTSGIIVNNDVGAGNNGAPATATATTPTRPIAGTRMVEVTVEYSNGKTSNFVQPETGRTIEEFAQEAIQYGRANGDISIKFNDWNGGSTGSYKSAGDIVEAYNSHMTDELTTRFIRGESIATDEDSDRIVGNLDKIERGFTLRCFGLNTEEFGRQLKFGENKEELQNKLREELRRIY